MLLSCNLNLMKMVRFLSLWLILSANGVFAAQSEPANQRHFTIAVGIDSYPYQFGDDKGRADGLMVDIWRLWAQRNGYTIDFKISSWQQSLAQLEQGKVDFHAGMAITEVRQ